MLQTTLLCLLAVLGQSGNPLDRTAEPSPGVPLRRYQELDRSLRDLLQWESRAATQAERATAAHAMLRLYEEIQRDPRMAGSPTLNQYRLRLAARLRRIAQEIRKHDRPTANRSGLATDVGHGELPRGQTPWQVASSPPVSASRQGFGMSAPVRGGGGGPADWGPELAALIERTIAPTFWDVQGGPGTVFYYRPQRALVVRATTEVHEDIAELLNDLRAAGP